MYRLKIPTQKWIDGISTPSAACVDFWMKGYPKQPDNPLNDSYSKLSILAPYVFIIRIPFAKGEVWVMSRPQPTREVTIRSLYFFVVILVALIFTKKYHIDYFSHAQ